MGPKDELVLVPCIWWPFTIYKMCCFPAFSLDSFHKYLLRPDSVPGTLLGAWGTSMNKIGGVWRWGGKSLSSWSLRVGQCIWSSEPPKVEPMAVPRDPLDLASEPVPQSCQLALKCIRHHLPLVPESSPSSVHLGPCHLRGTWGPQGHLEMMRW